MSIIHRTANLIRRIKNHRFYATYRLLSDFTMIPPPVYVANLKLIHFHFAASIPGAIVECGTWRGGMIAGIATLLGKDREYYLFDSFEGLPPAEPIDGQAAKRWQEDTKSPLYFNNCTASEKEAATAMSLAGIKDAKLVKGWFEDTLPQATFPNGIAVLRMDADWYKSTYQILDSLFSFVNENGLILIDDYYAWDGCSKAVHDYLSEHKRPERISSYEGVCFIRKRRSEQGVAADG